MINNIEDYNRIDKYFQPGFFIYNDIDVTYLVRNQFIASIRSSFNIGNKPVKLNFNSCYRLVLSGLRTLTSIFLNRNIWVFSNSERRKKYNGLYYDRVSSLVSEIDDSVLFIENPILVSHKSPTNDTILSDAIFFFLSFIYSKLFYKKDKLKIKNGLADLESLYKIKFNPHSGIQRFWGQYKVMSWFLKIKKLPHAVFIVYPNGYSGYIRAFKENNIPIIELQHGVIYENHPSYNYYYNGETPGRNFNPDYIFTYGSIDVDCLKRLNYLNFNNMSIVGSYGLWYCKNKLKVENTYINELKLDPTKKKLLITATNDDFNDLFKFGKDFALSNSNIDVLLLPRGYIQEYSPIQNFFIINPKKTNVFELYKISDYHLTQNSTCALEALFMNIPSFILELNRQSIFRRNYGFLKTLNYVKTGVELKILLSEKTFLEPNIKDVSQIFENNVILNFNEAIKKIFKFTPKSTFEND